MIDTYCNYGLWDDDACSCLEEGDFCYKFSYWDNEKRITLENVYVMNITQYDVTVELDDSTEININVEDVDSWG